MNEKKRKILIAAMKLFSKTSFHQTSMQQVADVCGVSKGSLYTHFKSKEELLSDIFSYYYQLLNDQIASSAKDSDTVQEAFIREIAIRIRHYCEFQEFFLMQMNEIKGLEDKSLNQFVRHENAKLVRKTGKSIVSVFGQEAAPYAADLTATLKGMLTSYMRGVLEEGTACDFNALAHFLFIQLEAAAQTLIEKQPEPFFTAPLMQELSEGWQEETVHPLHIVRKMKETAAASQAETIMVESVDILEKELMEMKPRRAVLSGMIRNLKESENLAELAEELEKTIVNMPATTLI
ncbi:TetR family transcriptional regulator [Bacillus aerolatus]|uniref:TetR family transcriptional regulator n=1 Tax=Bacillus aerolatus TaxID=2653354 RepID=A0A6I1FIA6_9BACI|nr:TetR/AcrR family transcriptional regulator [Bacillus aerolatus]KAB7705973.1 TetR family transcriptional regulator [Bacillus aerolatus]